MTFLEFNIKILTNRSFIRKHNRAGYIPPQYTNMPPNSTPN